MVIRGKCVAPISKTITINRRATDIWAYVTQLDHWALWWGGGLKSVSPGWAQDAILEWKDGPSSKLTTYDPPRDLTFRGPQATTCLKLESKGKTTAVELQDW